MLFFIIIVSVLLIYLFKNQIGKRRIPQRLKKIPIEKGLPIIGIVNKIQGPLCNYLVKLGQKHGPIFQIKLGMRDIVVLNTFEYIKAALVDNGDTLSGRWKASKYIFMTKNSGLAWIDGNGWAKQRSFVLRNMKDLGMGRSRSLEIIQDEYASMVEDLEKSQGNKIDFAHFIPIYLVNVISRFIMSRRFTHEDPLFQIVKRFMQIMVNTNDAVANFTLMFPFIENNEWLMYFILWVTSRKAFLDEYYKSYEREIDHHLNKLDFTSEGDDLMDRFLIKQRQLRDKQGSVGTFTNIQLVNNTSDLLIGGYETTSTALLWSFMFMGRYPEIQTKVYEEIIDKIGNERSPTMSDKVALNYTQAVLDEILRLSSIVPLAILHRTLDDVNVKGYFIPKDTVVIPNIFACHLDPNIWEKPLKFYPEHFLFPNNNGALKYKPREELIPFSMGKRQCPGESLARMEHFIFFTSVLQKYKVSLANEVERRTRFDVFYTSDGLVRIPTVKEFIFNRRSETTMDC